MKRSLTSLRNRQRDKNLPHTPDNQQPLQRQSFSSSKLYRKNTIKFKVSQGKKLQQQPSQKDRSVSLNKKPSQKIGDEKSKSQSKPHTPLLLSRIEGDRKTPTSLVTNRSRKPIPQQIQEYIKKREDVQVIQHYQDYKKQFYLKAKILHSYLNDSKEPEKIKNTYLNEVDSHFRNGLESIMLKLFRNGTIVPQSYNNMRDEAVQQIQMWVLGWIHRKMTYEQLVEEEEAQVATVEDTIKQIEDYKRQLDTQDTSF